MTAKKTIGNNVKAWPVRSRKMHALMAVTRPAVKPKIPTINVPSPSPVPAPDAFAVPENSKILNKMALDKAPRNRFREERM